MKFVLHAFPTHDAKKLAMIGDLNIDGSKTRAFLGELYESPHLALKIDVGMHTIMRSNHNNLLLKVTNATL